MGTKRAAINKPASVERMVGRLTRVNQATVRLEAQLKELGWTDGDRKRAIQRKLDLLKSEAAEISGKLAEIKAAVGKLV